MIRYRGRKTMILGVRSFLLEPRKRGKLERKKGSKARKATKIGGRKGRKKAQAKGDNVQ